jgi:predicted phage tail component-like protein
VATYGIQFNGTDLESGTPGLKILNRDVQSFPRVALEQYILARADIKKFVNVNYPERKITIDAIINGNNMANAEQNLDTLKGLLVGQDKNLDLPYGNSTRRWVATLSNLIAPRAKGSFIPISLEFDCSDPIGRDTTTTSQAITTITTASSSQSITVGGQFPCLPVITITLNSGTGLTAQSMTITNPTTGLAMTLTRTWVAGDVVIIDCYNQTVTVNGVTFDASGAWPAWAAGAGTYQYADTFTTRNVTTTFVYNARYL